MAKLTGDQQRFLTLANARFERVKHICQEYKKRFKEEVTPDQVSSYNLDTRHGQEDMGQELKDLFKATRDEYLNDEKTVGGFHRIHRVRELENLLDHPIVKASPRLAADIWKQIAQEEGGQFRQQQKGLSIQEALDMVLQRSELIRETICKVVPNEREQDRLLGAIDDAIRAKRRLAADGGRSGAEGDSQASAGSPVS